MSIIIRPFYCEGLDLQFAGAYKWSGKEKSRLEKLNSDLEFAVYYGLAQ